LDQSQSYLSEVKLFFLKQIVHFLTENNKTIRISNYKFIFNFTGFAQPIDPRSLLLTMYGNGAVKCMFFESYGAIIQSVPLAIIAKNKITGFTGTQATIIKIING